MSIEASLSPSGGATLSARPRIAVAGFQHETNTFAPIPTTFETFERGGAWPALQRGQAVLDTLPAINMPMGGFLKAAEGLDLVPLVWCFAEPGGTVRDEAFDTISAMIVDGVAGAGAIDGIYLDLHGAMTVESYPDGEGELLRRLRALVGPDLPIATSLDLHANMSALFVEHASSTAIYRTYPHIDMAATGARAGRLLRLELARGAPFAKAWRPLDFLVPIQAQSTRREPGATLYRTLAALNSEGLDSLDFAFGFPPADVHHCGPAVFAYGSAQAVVDEAAAQFATEVTACESALAQPLIAAQDAVAQAMARAGQASRPILIADAQDNPGAGATGDTTGLLRALIDAKVQRALFGMVYDPQAAKAAHGIGLGGSFEADIGGHCGPIGGPPVRARVEVIALSDGRFTFTGPMYGNATANLGPVAALQVLDAGCDLTLTVGSTRTQNADLAHFTHLGLDPTAFGVVAVKSAIHFLAAYEPIADSVILAHAPGANPCQLDTIPYRNLRAGVRLGPDGPAFEE
ncbi:MAG: M81 family metallopeptidase [Pseudomonadota bacterium]